MKEYIVSWYVQLSAESPEDAALQAYGMLLDPTNTATIFEVVADEDGAKTMIDTEGGEARIVRES